MRRRLYFLAFVSLLLSIALLSPGCSPDENPADPSPDVSSTVDDPAEPYHFLRGIEIAPIEGLTTEWHAVPSNFALPAGVVPRFRVEVPTNGEVSWSGAVEVERDGATSLAECRLEGPGEYRVDVATTVVTGDEGGEGGKQGDKGDLQQSSSQVSFSFRVLDVDVRDIRVADVALTRFPVELDENSSNWVMTKRFKEGTIASLNEVGDGHFVTSVGGDIEVAARTSPAAFGPLTEWRIDGKAVLLGESGNYRNGPAPASYVVSVGPPANGEEIRIDTYHAKIQMEGVEPGAKPYIPDGEPVMFTATTEPPGYENYVNWIAATRYGTTDVRFGTGPEFTVAFFNTLNVEGWQWVGVRADDAVFAQDAKCGTGSSTISDAAVVATDAAALGDFTASTHCSTGIKSYKVLCESGPSTNVFDTLYDMVIDDCANPLVLNHTTGTLSCNNLGVGTEVKAIVTCCCGGGTEYTDLFQWDGTKWVFQAP